MTVEAHGAHHDVAHHDGGHHDDAHDAHEEVVAPDQLRRTVSPRLARFGLLATVILLPILAFIGNHEGNVEKIFLVAIAGLLLLMLIMDFFLRRAGLRSE